MNPISEIFLIEQLKETIEAQSKIIESGIHGPEPTGPGPRDSARF